MPSASASRSTLVETPAIAIVVIGFSPKHARDRTVSSPRFVNCESRFAGECASDRKLASIFGYR
jgi:hypothetical protein